MAECQFCGNDAKLTDEHGWPETALAFVRKKAGGGDHRVWTPTPTGETRIFTGEKPALKAKVSCQTCNSERLQRIEADADSVVMPLIAGSPRIILKGDPQLLALARWCVRCAMVLEFTTDDPIPFFSLDERKALAIDRRIPEGVFIGLGVFMSSRPTAFYFPLTPRWEGRLDELHVSTFTIGQLVVQLVAYRDETGTPYQLVTKPPTSLKQLWPPSGLNILWPPRFGFDNESLMELGSFVGPKVPPPTRPPSPTPSRRRSRQEKGKQ